MATKILAFGWSDDDVWAGYRAAIEDVFGGDAEATRRDAIPQELSLREVLLSDLVLVRVPEAPDRHPGVRGFLLRTIDAYPYLPVVVVGEVERLRQEFYAVGAARYLPGDWKPKQVIREAARAVGGAWWYGVQAFDQPLVVVDRKGIIVRANAAARLRFGGKLVGKFYLKQVEGRSSKKGWPPGHPIATALGFPRDESREARRSRRRGWPAPEGASRYWQYPIPDSDPGRAQLVCVPVLGLRNEVQAVCVLIVEMTRWASIFHASADLADAADLADDPDLDSLCESIVGAVHDRLGYERVRLYQYVESPGGREGPILRGRASRGFNSVADRKLGFPDKHEGLDRVTFFKEKFSLPVRGDAASDWLERHRLPVLCLTAEPQPADPAGGPKAEAAPAPEPEPSGHQPHLVQVFVRRTVDLEVDGPVTRWVDVPLLIPGAAGEPPRFWGKLSIDRLERRDDGSCDDRSDQLTARDVADLTMFGVVAAGAIAAKEKQRRLDKRLNAFGQTGNELSNLPPAATAPRPRPWSFAPAGLRVILKLFLRLTRADVVYFRGYHRVKLTVESDGAALIEWRDGRKPPGVDVPPDASLEDGYSASLLELVKSDGHWGGDVPPEPESKVTVLTDTELAEKKTDLRIKYGWSGAQLALLEYPHEVYAPVVIDRKFQGAFVAVSRKKLSTEGDPDWGLLRLFCGAAGRWFELGVRNAEQSWWEPTLTQLLEVLPKVEKHFGRKTAPDDPVRHGIVYAGLAAMLTAHNGIGWNRCFIFEVNLAHNAADLVYAIGELGDPNYEAIHITEEEKRKHLQDTVDPLLKKPIPRHPVTKELDQLYEWCVVRPAEGDRVQLREADPSKLAKLLFVDPASPNGNTLPGFFPAEDDWCKGQEQRFTDRRAQGGIPRPADDATYPRMFAAREAFAFPLWGADPDGTRRPLALVVVDMAYRPHESVGARVPATRLFLNVIADALAAWDRDVSHNVSAAVNYVLHHGKDVKTLLSELLTASHLPTDLRASVDGLHQKLEKLIQAGSEQLEKGNEPGSGIELPVITALSKIRRDWHNTHQFGRQIQLRVKSEVPGTEDPMVPCPEPVLGRAIEELIRNAAQVTEEGRATTITLTVRVNRDRLPPGVSIIEIDVTDNGPGIAADEKKLFLPGFTTKTGGNGGTGLAFVRRALNRHHGDLERFAPACSD